MQIVGEETKEVEDSTMACYNSYVGESYQTPYGGNYDIVPSPQAFFAHSSQEFSNQNLFEYNLAPNYGAYDPAMDRSIVAYSASTYTEPKSMVYNLYDGGYSPEIATQFRISYSASEFNDLDFEEYDPTPYDGGYDLSQTYGKPLQPSEAICYPRSTPPSNGFSDGNENSDLSAPKPYIESKETLANKDGQQQQVHPGSGEQLIENKTNHGQDNGSASDEGNSYEYEKIAAPQIPSGYGLEAMDLCESIFGHWPCLARYNERGHGCQEVVRNRENSSNQWKETADYLFGSSYPYEERSGGDVIYSYQRHHQA